MQNSLTTFISDYMGYNHVVGFFVFLFFHVLYALACYCLPSLCLPEKSLANNRAADGQIQGLCELSSRLCATLGVKGLYFGQLISLRLWPTAVLFHSS